MRWGLGKTIEAGLILRDLLVAGVVERCLILAPASVLRQWQDELREKFALEVPIYESGQLVGPGPRSAGPAAHRPEPVGGGPGWCSPRASW
ncbi:MAG: hypothetical protein KatS3mg014_1250 [Actinomycetota bacterium]|nr:MAG: hypothetical protein KatS3mg014_1250 [Actinomycetota bacterium]